MERLKTTIPFIFLFSLFAFGCVSPISFSVPTEEGILVIDGILDEKEIFKKISLSRTRATLSYASYLPEINATVNILEDQNSLIKTEEITPGNYFLPKDFTPVFGKTYQLQIKLNNGVKYESSFEQMKKTPEISRLFSVFEETGIEFNGKKMPAHYVYLETKDVDGKGDNYLWNYKLIEKQPYCKSCYEGLFYPDPISMGRCEKKPELVEITYDYRCANECWEILENNKINVQSDFFVNGNKITGRLIAKIPYYQITGCLVEVYQKNINQQAFNYLKTLSEQSETNGNLLDILPAALIGNIKNLSDKFENVSGYFALFSEKKKTIWISRKDIKGYKPIGIEGKIITPEPDTEDLTRPPLAQCILSNFRTPFKPEGWEE